jgi:hypothetical protein
MFGRYALPSDDLLAAYTPTITTIGSPAAEDPAFPITNWLEVKPAKPSKLLSDSGGWDVDFGSAANVAVVALLYHNFDPGLSVLLEWDSDPAFSPAVGSQAITIPEWTEDEWTVSPWIEVTGSPTYRYWRLSISGSNSQALSLGRPYFGGALRDLTNDVRWGEVEDEDFKNIEHQTDLDVETIYPIGGKRRRFNGEFALRNEAPYEHAQELISLHRSSKGRFKPWLLIPDVDVNDAWIVRFEENRWSRTRETINHNIFPFRVQELARGLPWPWPPT